MTRSQLLATAIVAGFFFLLLWSYVANVYGQRFFDHGGIVVAWQAARIAFIPYLIWLQYAVGYISLSLRERVGERASAAQCLTSARGCSHFITCFLLGTSIWHIALFLLGLAGLLFYPVMLLLAGGVMIASWKQLVSVIPAFARGSRAQPPAKRESLDPRSGAGEKIMALLVLLAALLFIFLKGAYPSGGHDYFNHYFPYYKEVVATGSLGPHQGWYHYFYSKGLGLFFMSMILLDPFAVQLVGATFILAAACMVYDLLRTPGQSRLLPLFGVLIYFLFYTYTRGRGLFAANGGWGDLEKTHELSAVMLLGCVWLVQRIFAAPEKSYVLALSATAAALGLISYPGGMLAGCFFAAMLPFAWRRGDAFCLRSLFIAGASAGAVLVLLLAVNYVKTGIPLDYFVTVFWPFIGWEQVMAGGYSLELFATLNHVLSYEGSKPSVLASLPMIFSEYYRLYLFWPLLVVAVLLFFAPRKGQEKIFMAHAWVLLVFLFTALLFALTFGGRSVPVSFFRFSSFNYAPVLVVVLLLMGAAHPRPRKYVLWLIVLALVPWAIFREPHVARGWYRLASAAVALNTGDYSLRDAVADQRGRVGRLRHGGVYPALEEIYSALPAGTRVWSFHNHSYCMLPACNVQQYYSQITSPRWYEIALGSVDEGKRIMQEEGLNFFFYSRSVPVVGAAETQDQLAVFFKGLSPENIGDNFGVLWTNGWDYLLTWKEEAAAPLPSEFMDSWRIYHKNFIVPRRAAFPVDRLAAMVKEALGKGDYGLMPTAADTYIPGKPR